MTSKILEGAKQALAFVRGEGPAGRVTSFVGGPYYKGPGRGLIQHHVGKDYIAWNWDTAKWDTVKAPVHIADHPSHAPPHR